LTNGQPTIIPSSDGTTRGGKAFPSYVVFREDGFVLVGEAARQEAAFNIKGTVSGIKDKLGTNYRINIFGKQYTSKQIATLLLQKIRRDAESFLRDKVDKAVIAVPSYFNDYQRNAIKDAGEMAGLQVIRMVNEPIAACLAYGLDRIGRDLRIMVFDLGAAQLEITIVEIRRLNGEAVLEIRSRIGNAQLGGVDMDKALTDYILDELKRKKAMDPKELKATMQEIRDAAESAKIELSTATEAQIQLRSISGSQMTLSRMRLEEVVRPMIEACGQPILEALADVKMTLEDIDKFILVGGPTHMPIVRKFLEDFVGKAPETSIDPSECIALGAAIAAGRLPLPLGEKAIAAGGESNEEIEVRKARKVADSIIATAERIEQDERDISSIVTEIMRTISDTVKQLLETREGKNLTMIRQGNEALVSLLRTYVENEIDHIWHVIEQLQQHLKAEDMKSINEKLEPLVKMARGEPIEILVDMRPPVTVEEDAIVIEDEKMEIGEWYDVEFMGRKYLVQKKDEDVIDLYVAEEA